MAVLTILAVVTLVDRLFSTAHNIGWAGEAEVRRDATPASVAMVDERSMMTGLMFNGWLGILLT